MISSKIRVLSIDGGGIRGVIPAQILIHVEKLLKEISRDDTAKISDYFDLIAGTSTGGIITAMILTPEEGFSAEEIVNLYKEHGEKIFTRSTATKKIDKAALFNPLYQHENIEKIFETYFKDLTVGEFKRPCLIPTYNIETGEATFISGLPIKDNPHKDRFIREILRETTAAPTYFAPVQHATGAFIDGGMFANNPALCAYVEATKFPCKPRAKDIMLLSIGTGATHRTYKFDKAFGWGRLSWIKPALEIYASAASQTVNHQLRILYKDKDLAHNYLRIEADLSKYDVNPAMDDASSSNILKLIDIGVDLSEKFDSELREFLKGVVLSNILSAHVKLYEKSK